MQLVLNAHATAWTCSILSHLLLLAANIQSLKYPFTRANWSETVKSILCPAKTFPINCGNLWVCPTELVCNVLKHLGCLGRKLDLFVDICCDHVVSNVEGGFWVRAVVVAMCGAAPLSQSTFNCASRGRSSYGTLSSWWPFTRSIATCANLDNFLLVSTTRSTFCRFLICLSLS